MKKLDVLRYGSIPGYGTFGRLNVWDDSGKLLFECFTIEKEWLDNEAYKSCIPSGIYIIELGMYYSGDGVGGKADYPAYVVCDVPNRSLIKIHIANRASELLGCIAPGMELGTMVNGDWCVKNSTIAFERFMQCMAGDKRAKLKIRWRNVDKETIAA